MGRRSDRVPTGAQPPPASRPFAALADLVASRGGLPEAPAPDPPQAAAPAAPEDPVTRAKKVVVRRERKGHGGKTATRVEGLVGTPAELEGLAREWKRSLGCGAAVDGADILVQGDQGERLIALLGSRGARKVVLGN